MQLINHVYRIADVNFNVASNGQTRFTVALLDKHDEMLISMFQVEFQLDGV